jgi:hypothetical protein
MSSIHKNEELKSGTEMTLIGLGEAIVTYLIGMLIAPMIG